MAKRPRDQGAENCCGNLATHPPLDSSTQPAGADPLQPINHPAGNNHAGNLGPCKPHVQHAAGDLQDGAVYWESYEQAALSLRQLHFERIQRHGGVMPPS
ncbi:hypothetical protein N2152v2_005366 [Parachlorella kessleri]